jgi:hypothetical protein
METTKHFRLTINLEIQADIPADASTYFIARNGEYPGTHYASSDADQVEGVILDMVHRHLPELVGDWRIKHSFIEEIKDS